MQNNRKLKLRKQVTFTICILYLSLTTLSFTGSNKTIIPNESFTIKNEIKAQLQKLIYMEGGSFTMGRTSGVDILMTESDSTLFSSMIPKKATIEPFYISATEVTNQSWREFYLDKVKELGITEAKKRFYPDTLLWLTEYPYSYNDPMARHYHRLAYYDNYPVVGISWNQAKAFCQWKTEKLKALLDKEGISSTIQFRLPTEAEWEFAATRKTKGVMESKDLIYEWPSNYTLPKLNELANIGPVYDRNNVQLKDYAEDGCLYICEVASYPSNERNVFDMAGNVSEWTEDHGYTYSFYTENDEFNSLRLTDKTVIEREIARHENNLNARENSFEYNLNWLKHDLTILARENIRICKGGSWVKGLVYTQIGSRQGFREDQRSTQVGFRLAISNLDQNVIKYLPKKNWKPKKRKK